jgi:hypothetical protein
MEQRSVSGMSQRKWVSLIEGVRILIRLEDQGDRLAALITRPNWDMYEHRNSELIEQAQKMFDSVTGRLSDQLSQAKIRGEGFHEDTGHRGPITESEWEGRFINFWRNALLNHLHQNEKQYPCVTAVEINVDDLLRVNIKDDQEKLLRNANQSELPARGYDVFSRLKSWYRDKYVGGGAWRKILDANGRPPLSTPSERDDLDAARESIGNEVSRTMIREVRGKFAPTEWTASGRRRR